ncbi:MAG: hypothetical protein PVF82_19390 [Gammaproteobacteria bacterium]|jgi:hypothetical protein
MMNIDELIRSIETFYANNTELTIAIIVTLVIAILLKPKEIKNILLGVGIIAAIGYLIVSLSGIVSTGIDSTNEVGIKTDRQYQNGEQ